MRRRVEGLVVAGLIAICTGMAASPLSQANTYRVTEHGDHAGVCDTHCALREALMAANATSANDRVKVPEGHYVLSIGSPDTFSGCAGDADWGDLDICPDSGALRLIGAGAKRTVIDANRIDRVLEVYPDGVAPGAPVRISGLTLTGGRSNDEGGGLRADGTRPTTLVRSVIEGNRTFGPPGSGPNGGGIVNRPLSFLILKKTTVRANTTASGGGDGGGIANEATLAIRASTISGNVAHDQAPGYDGDGGGLNNTGTATIVNSTFSGNRAGSAFSSDGGAIYTDGDLSVLNTTIAFNSAESGSGIAAVDRPENTQTVQNTILARNRLSAGGTDNCGGFFALVSLGHNLEQGSSCGFVGPGDIHGPARLAPLAGNGGPTKTHALRRHSKAINHSKNSACPSTDQRGIHRPQGPRCDIGAFERKN